MGVKSIFYVGAAWKNRQNRPIFFNSGVFVGIAFRVKQLEFRHETYSVDRLKAAKMDKQASK